MAIAPPRKLLIFPFNGNGVEALDCLGDAYALAGFVDDTPHKQGPSPYGCAVYSREILLRHPDWVVLAVPGSPSSFPHRREIIAGLNVAPDRFAFVVHRSASVSPLARIGRNVLLMAGVVVTANAVIGEHVCVLPNTVIHHDVRVGDYTLIGSNVSVAGGATIGDNAYIGSGSRLMNGITVGAGALVGLGSNVIRDVPPGARVAGNPARPVRSSKPSLRD